MEVQASASMKARLIGVGHNRSIIGNPNLDCQLDSLSFPITHLTHIPITPCRHGRKCNVGQSWSCGHVFQVPEQVAQPGSNGQPDHDQSQQSDVQSTVDQQQQRSDLKGPRSASPCRTPGAAGPPGFSQWNGSRDDAKVEVRRAEGTPSASGAVAQQPQLRGRGAGHRGGSAVADDPVAERLPGGQVRRGLGAGQEPQHPRPQVQGAQSRSRASRRRERRRRAQLLGALPQKQVR